MKAGAGETVKAAGGDKALRIAIAGAGAIGTLFGTTLILGGNKVQFYDGWETLLKAMKENPKAVRIENDGTEKEVPVEVLSYDEVPEGAVDVLWLAVKSSQTRSTLEKLKKVIGPDTVILTLQGGFDNPDVISEFQTNKKLIMYGRTTCSSKPVQGRMMTIQNFAVAETTVWPFGTESNEQPEQRCVDVVEAINAAGLEMKLTSDAIAERWKMVLYYPANIAYSAIVKKDFLTCWKNQPSCDVLTALAKEVALIAKLEGVDQKLFNEEISIEAVRKLAEEECPQHMGSMHADIENKRITENDATAGFLLKIAQKHNVELPTMKVIYGMINCIENNY